MTNALFHQRHCSHSLWLPQLYCPWITKERLLLPQLNIQGRYCEIVMQKKGISKHSVKYFFPFQIEISSHSLQFQNVTDHSDQAGEKKTDSNLWQLREKVKCLVFNVVQIKILALPCVTNTTALSKCWYIWFNWRLKAISGLILRDLLDGNSQLRGDQ